MSKFYIISEEEIYNMHGYADQREWDEPEIFRKEVLNPAYEVEFDGDLREFVKNKMTKSSLKASESCWISVKNTGCLIPVYECFECKGSITGVKPPYCLWCGRKMKNKYKEKEK